MAGLSRALDRVGIPLTMLETCIDRKDDMEHSLTVQLLQDNHKRCDGRTLKSIAGLDTKGKPMAPGQ